MMQYFASILASGVARAGLSQALTSGQLFCAKLEKLSRSRGAIVSSLILLFQCVSNRMKKSD